jgi:hypothetical protein
MLMMMKLYHVIFFFLLHLFALCIKKSATFIPTMRFNNKKCPRPSSQSQPAVSVFAACATGAQKEDADKDTNNTCNVIQSQCQCGQVTINISLSPNNNNDNSKVWNCHCPSCRRYHTSAYVSYLQIPRDQLSIRTLANNDDDDDDDDDDDKSVKETMMIGRYTSSPCQTLLEKANNNNSNSNKVMERWFCTNCSSKLLSVIVSSNSSSAANANNNDNHNKEECLVNLGTLNQNTIPKSFSNRWKEQLKKIESNLVTQHEGRHPSSCHWAGVLPSNNYENVSYSERRGIRLSTASIWLGGCDCGACRYKITLTRLTQLQHCYCNLCRKLSGGPFSSWLPIDRSAFEWEDSSSVDALNLVRTTSFGQRHICKICRSVLTIVYDDQPNLIWPCAGSLDDATLPKNKNEMRSFLSRVCHICCLELPPWLDLVEDGMEKLDDAS